MFDRAYWSREFQFEAFVWEFKWLFNGMHDVDPFSLRVSEKLSCYCIFESCEGFMKHLVCCLSQRFWFCNHIVDWFSGGPETLRQAFGQCR